MTDVYYYEVKLPDGINEMVAPDYEGGYTVYVDERLDCYMKVQAFRHAMSHIENCDWEKDNVQEIEANAHR